MIVMTAYSELTQFIPPSQTLLWDTIFGSCLKHYSVADLLKCWCLWHLFKLELGPHWVVTEDNEIKDIIPVYSFRAKHQNSCPRTK